MQQIQVEILLLELPELLLKELLGVLSRLHFPHRELRRQEIRVARKLREDLADYIL
jgi:hypothetical protein